MSGFSKTFSNGIVKENPLVALMIGLCSALAVSTSVSNGLVMGLSTTFVLLMSEITISILKKTIPNSIRCPVFIVVVASFTTVIDYMLRAYLPEASEAIGVFIMLIAVNCLIMGRVEAFASKNSVPEVIPDALGMGFGFTWVLVGISAVRELLGNGTLLSIQILPYTFQPILFFVMPTGGFFVFALFISLNTFLKSKAKPVKEE